jgi:hypothetical protein
VNRYETTPEGFKHYILDELRAVVPWASADLYRESFPDAPREADHA